MKAYLISFPSVLTCFKEIFRGDILMQAEAISVMDNSFLSYTENDKMNSIFHNQALQFERNFSGRFWWLVSDSVRPWTDDLNKWKTMSCNFECSVHSVVSLDLDNPFCYSLRTKNKKLCSFTFCWTK